MFGRDKEESEGDESVTNVPVQTADDAVQATPVADPAANTPQDVPVTEPVTEAPLPEAPATETPEPTAAEVPEPEALPEPETTVSEAPIPETPAVEVPAPAESPVPEETVDPNEAGMEQEAPAETPAEPIDTPVVSVPANLTSLKLEALHALSPLIGQLDQSPEEQYETAKMIYEQTNDQSTLGPVYEAAKNLPDDKAKATAIYDVIKKIDAL